MDGQEVTRLETTYLPESNENLIRMYGADGELIHEQIMAVDLGREVMPTSVEYGYGEMRYYGDTNVLEWTATDVPHYTQSTSSNAYSVRNYRNLDLDLWPSPADVERAQTDDNVVWPRRVRAERKARIFCDGEWTGGIEYEEQPDIKDERGGALDEFIDGLKPQKTTPERSDKQK